MKLGSSFSTSFGPCFEVGTSLMNILLSLIETINKALKSRPNIAFARGGAHFLPHFFCTNLPVNVKLGYPPNFYFLGKPLLGEKYVEGRRKQERKKEGRRRRIMPSLVATTSTPARKPFVRTHYTRKLSSLDMGHSKPSHPTHSNVA